MTSGAGSLWWAFFHFWHVIEYEYEPKKKAQIHSLINNKMKQKTLHMLFIPRSCDIFRWNELFSFTVQQLLSDFQPLWEGQTGIMALNRRSAGLSSWKCWPADGICHQFGWLLCKWVRHAAVELIMALSFFGHNHGFHESCQSRFELWAWA